MIDLHTHTLFSDGVLVPSELVSRARAAGYEALGLTDHGDAANIDFIVPRIVRVCDELSRAWAMPVIPGIELTHVPPAHIAALAVAARNLGAKLVIVHGETIVEPVPSGTNRAAIEAEVDILAHPGLIADEDAALAAANGVLLEISTRRGHSMTNGHVLQAARRAGAALIMNNDAHAPKDFVSHDMGLKIARGAGMTEAEIAAMLAQSRRIVDRIAVPMA